MTTELSPAAQEQLIQTATRAMERAYAPYSQFKVGAALLTDNNEVFSGCNVENASYGLSICAERNAIANAIIGSSKDTIIIKAIAVVNSQQVSCSPCGACRQVIWEFGRDAQVIFQGSQGWHTAAIKDLLPEGFTL